MFDHQKAWHATTILCLREKNKVLIIGDGQVSLGNTIVKSSANKIRTLVDGKVVAGFAGSTADAFTLFSRLEEKMEKHSNNLMRSAVELAKDWRLDKYLRKLEAMLIVANEENTLLLSGSGDVLEPEDGIAAIGSGGNYALAAAKSLIDVKGISLEEKAHKAMTIAADICVFTNYNFVIKKI